MGSTEARRLSLVAVQGAKALTAFSRRTVEREQSEMNKGMPISAVAVALVVGVSSAFAQEFEVTPAPRNNGFEELRYEAIASFTCHSPPSPTTLERNGQIRTRDNYVFSEAPVPTEIEATPGSTYVAGSGILKNGTFHFKVRCVASQIANRNSIGAVLTKYGHISITFAVKRKPNRALQQYIEASNEIVRLERRRETLMQLRDQQIRHLDSLNDQVQRAHARSRILSDDVKRCSIPFRQALAATTIAQLYDLRERVRETRSIKRIVTKSPLIIEKPQTVLKIIGMDYAKTLARGVAIDATIELVSRGYCIQKVYNELSPSIEHIRETIDSVRAIDYQFEALDRRIFELNSGTGNRNKAKLTQ